MFLDCPGGGIGRHKGLKIPRQQWRAGSSPAPGTTSYPYINPEGYSRKTALTKQFIIKNIKNTINFTHIIYNFYARRT